MVSHPSVAELRGYNLGELPDAVAEGVAKHLSLCAACKSRAAELSAGSQSGTPAASPKPTGLSGVPVAVPRKPNPASPPPPELLLLKQYGNLKELGRGGMGVVYLAKHIPMARLEVLKVVQRSHLERSGQGAVERFLREIQAAARLQHPNVVTAYTVHTPGDLLVFAMEYAPGADLAKVVRGKGPLPVPVACSYVIAAALGLQHAHEKGMVHRDIKPSNLIVTKVDGKTGVKILDFGLAKLTGGEGNDLTRDGSMMGTPDYMAPEQAVDAARADIRADVYSLGCTLHFLLTGRAPFSGGTVMQVIDRHRFTEPKSLDESLPGCPAGLAAVAAKMLAKDPANRYQTPAEVARALRPFVTPSAGQPQPKSAEFWTVAADDWRSDSREDDDSDNRTESRRGGLIALIVASAVATLAAVGVGGAWLGGAFAAKPQPVPVAAPLPAAVPVPQPVFVPPAVVAPLTPTAPPISPVAGNDTLTAGSVWRGELTGTVGEQNGVPLDYRLTILSRNLNRFDGTVVREKPRGQPFPVEGIVRNGEVIFTQSSAPRRRRGVGTLTGNSFSLTLYNDDLGTRVGTLKLATAELESVPEPPEVVARPKPPESVADTGPSAESEAAVNRGLAWLANQQRPDGSWHYDGTDSDDSAGATAVALLPYLAAGHTHKSGGGIGKTVGGGLNYLKTNQLPSGRFAHTARGSKYSMPSHARVTLALCEALGMTRDPLLVRPAQLAVNLITAAQAADGSWGESPGQVGSTIEVGWQIQALAAAKQCRELRVDPASFARATKFLDGVASGPGDSRYGVTKPANHNPESTAVGLYCRRVISGWTAANEGLSAGSQELAPIAPPRRASIRSDFYYYATLDFRAVGGEAWAEWNPAMRDLLVSRQETTGQPSRLGSWPPDPSASQTGRLGATAIALLTLEVTYRDRPLAERDAKRPAIAPEVARAKPGDGFKPLVTEKDLTGWKPIGLEAVEWTNANGTLTARNTTRSGTPPDEGGSLVSARDDYADFELKFEAKLARSHHAKLNFRRGKEGANFRSYDVVLTGNGPGDGGAFSNTGNLFTYHDGANYMQVKAGPAPDTTQPGEWFAVALTVRGDRIQVSIDGKQVLDHTVRQWDAGKGAISFSYGEAAPFSIRGVEIRELGDNTKPADAKPFLPEKPAAAAPLTPLFNGKDTAKWATHAEFNGTWKVEAGALVGRGVPGLNGSAFLDTDARDFKNFHLKAEVENHDAQSPTLDIRSSRQSITGLTGVGYRIALGGGNGFGGKVAPGSIWRMTENNRPGPVPDAPGKSELTKPGERYTLEIIADNNRIRVLIDGREVNDYTDPSRVADAGRISLICRAESGVTFFSIGIRRID